MRIFILEVVTIKTKRLCNQIIKYKFRAISLISVKTILSGKIEGKKKLVVEKKNGVERKNKNKIVQQPKNALLRGYNVTIDELVV